MRAVFDGTVLSSASFAPGETWLSTFRINGQQVNQTRRPIRDEYAHFIARGLRQHSIEIVFRPPPAADFDEAAELLCLYFSELPQQGDLVLLSGTRERTFADACLESFTPPPRRGVSNEYPVKFIAGAVTSRTRSRLGIMSADYPNVLPLTALTGGATNSLDAEVTTDVATGRMVNFYLEESGVLAPHQWVLRPWGEESEDAAAGRVLPDDFNESTNAKIWIRLI